LAPTGVSLKISVAHSVALRHILLVHTSQRAEEPRRLSVGYAFFLWCRVIARTSGQNSANQSHPRQDKYQSQVTVGHNLVTKRVKFNVVFILPHRHPLGNEQEFETGTPHWLKDI
jgi:hypothetical protein